MSVEGIHLYSGGLDSLLSAKLLMEQGIELIGLHFLLPFTPPHLNPNNMQISRIAKQIGLHIEFYRCDMEYMDIIKNPPHGYGKNINPCVDCKIYFLKRCKTKCQSLYKIKNLLLLQ